MKEVIWQFCSSCSRFGLKCATAIVRRLEWPCFQPRSAGLRAQNKILFSVLLAAVDFLKFAEDLLHLLILVDDQARCCLKPQQFPKASTPKFRQFSSDINNDLDLAEILLETSDLLFL